MNRYKSIQINDPQGQNTELSKQSVLPEIMSKSIKVHSYKDTEESSEIVVSQMYDVNNETML